MLVGGSVKRGVVASCSYEARAFGIKSAMPMAEAMRRCPHAIVVKHRMERYVEASRTFFAILGDFSPEVEGLSLDEAFLDCTGSERLLGDGPTIARAIKQRVTARDVARRLGRRRADQVRGEDRVGHRQARRPARGDARGPAARSSTRCR